MTLCRRFILYIVALHLVFATSAVWFLHAHPIWLIAIEVFFVASLAVGMRLVRSYFGPLELVRSGTHHLREGEFTTRFTPTGQKDMDQLLDVYNQMVDKLRQERIRNEEQEHLLQKVLAESPGGVITLDVNGNVDTINPAAKALLGVTADTLTGYPLTDLGTSFSRQLAELPSDESCLLTLRGCRRVRCQAATFMDRGFPRRFILLDELTAELYRSEKLAYEKLIRMMSHEVNNTSGAVQSLLQSCLGYRYQLTDSDHEDFKQALEVAIQRTANLDAFMRDFAEVVRLPRPRLQPTDPWEIATQVGLLFRDRCELAEITWHEDLEPNLPRIDCDPVQFEQVLLNLVKNAVEAIEAKHQPGEIVLRGGHLGHRCYLSLADTGTGLSTEVKAQLFTPFYTTREKGQGIGLTMVQEILLTHGFDFTLENRSEGGAEFRIHF